MEGVEGVPSAAEQRWDESLEGPARAIAELDVTPLRVLAGPGTGKTYALKRRVARLLQTGVAPGRILVSTFTRTAARDLETELRALGIAGIDEVQTGTLHSLCYRILMQDDVLRATGRVPRMLLKFEERFLLEDLDDEGFGGIKERRERLGACSAAWARLQHEAPGWPVDAVDRAFDGKLWQWLVQHSAMLVGEMVPQTLRYLRNNPMLPSRSAFDHVLVDEYQDLNRAEQALLDLLAEDGQLLVIGDEDQSIYSFKHAHPDGIADFHTTHQGTHDETLHECRRCPSLVVAMANALISHNTARAPRALASLLGCSLGNATIVQWPSLEEEAAGLAEYVARKTQAGVVEPGDLLVLAPRRQIGYMIRDRLNELGVLAHSFFHEEALDGVPRQLDASPAQQAFTLLTLLGDPDDAVGLRCWSGFGSSSLRQGGWRRVTQEAHSAGLPLREICRQLSEHEINIAYTKEIGERYAILAERVAELGGLRGQALVDAVFPAGSEWAGPLRTLAAAIAGDVFDAAELRETVRIGVTQPELPLDADYVRVMSLHKSKGLTARMVIVAGCVEGLIPTHVNGTGREQIAALEEQRRLFYVALTRATETLILSCARLIPWELVKRMGARVTKGDAENGVSVTSRFWNELGPQRPDVVAGTDLLED